MLQWAHQRGGPWEDSISPSAAGGGHLDVLKWAHEVVRGEASTCTSAAQGGHLEVLKWARQQWIPWGDTFDAAVRCGHLELLQWAYGKGCPWSIHSLRLACVYTHLDIAVDSGDQRAAWPGFPGVTQPCGTQTKNRAGRCALPLH